MIAGFAAQEQPRSVLGIDGSATVQQTWEQIARIARSTAEAIELGRALADDEIVLLDEWHAGTYGIPDEKTLDAIRLCAPGSRACSPIRSTRASRWRRSSTSSATVASSRGRACCTRTSAGSRR